MKRSLIAFAHDLIMAALAVILALYLRLGSQMSELWPIDSLMAATGLFVGIAAVVFWSQRLYRGIWRYASLNDLMAILKAVTLTVLIYLPVLFLLTRAEAWPRSSLIITWFVLLFLLGGPRLLYRLWKDRRLDLKLLQDHKNATPVLLIGAGDGAELFIRTLHRSLNAPYQAVGILAQGSARVGREIHGVKVLGRIEELEKITADLKRRDRQPQRIVLTEDHLDGQLVRDLLERAEALGLALARLPRLTDLRQGAIDEVKIQPIAIEDLLGRAQAVLDRSAMKSLIHGRRVLVTGAGGSIGSELVRQISDFAPSRLVLVDAGEFNLYSIDLELAARHPELPRAALLADIRDAHRIEQIFASETPELVFHAAALKHVPLVEINPCEGVLTNAIGTRIIADCCRTHGVRVMVQISTDKAVNPTNVMGASKRIAESYCQALDFAACGSDTRFVTVRFGNVLGSTGSVVPLFQKQLQAGGPLTVTHPEMTRYFMTIREAVELVLQASALGVSSSDHAGKIFVLDMGDPIKIVDLARQMIRLAGLRPDIDIAIDFTGLRPGEKLFEEIFHGAERPIPTEKTGILLAAPRLIDHSWLAKALDDLERACRRKEEMAALGLLSQLVPDYQTQKPVVSA